MDAAALLAEARSIAEKAYAPYSKFRVGAIAVAADGRHFTGANVENAAYGSGMCAEASAIAAAVSAGVRKIDVVAVGCLDGGQCHPCGNCLQLMREFDVETVVVQTDDLDPEVVAFGDLLPRSFGPESLPDSS